MTQQPAHRVSRSPRELVLGDGTEANPSKVGRIHDPSARILRLVHISDTHGKHARLTIQRGDILVHSGDFIDWSNMRTFELQAVSLDEFFRNQPHQHKIFVAGNHELKFQKTKKNIAKTLQNCIYLEDAGVVLDGVRFYGSPWTRERGTVAHAFESPDRLIGEQWDKIPRGIDVLITHSPPAGILDCNLGCPLLTNTVLKRVRPLVHLFGHQHDLHDVINVDDVLFSNGAQALRGSKPHVIDIYLPSRSIPSPDLDLDDELNRLSLDDEQSSSVVDDF